MLRAQVFAPEMESFSGGARLALALCGITLGYACRAIGVGPLPQARPHGGCRADAYTERTQSGCRADAERTRGGCRAESGPRADVETERVQSIHSADTGRMQRRRGADTEQMQNGHRADTEQASSLLNTLQP